MKIVVVGGSFGGLTAAYELRKRLSPSECDIVLVSKDRNFVFIPSLPWVAMGSKTLDQLSFDLGNPLARKRIAFTHATVQRIEAVSQTVVTDTDTVSYDYLVIATGHRSANEALPGLGPFGGPGHSLMSPPEAERARDAVQRLLDDPGPIVVGCAPGASCIGPAYEFVFEIDRLVRRARLRHRVPITFLTPEPFLGHFGIGGVGQARPFFEGEFAQRDIRFTTSAAVSKITDSSVELEDGTTFESRLSLVIPPLAGVDAIVQSPGLGNPKGFVPVDAQYRHAKFPNVYAVGVAVAFPPVDETPVPVNFPKTAHMTEQMATVAAHNIVADIRGHETESHELHTECILDMGDTAAHIVVDPVRPPRNVSSVSAGRHWLWAKRSFAHYYLWTAKRGMTAPRGWGW